VLNVTGDEIVAAGAETRERSSITGGGTPSRIRAVLAAMARRPRPRGHHCRRGGFLMGEGRLKPNLEGRELEEKLEHLGLRAPWMD
jgi:hypothetical protein